MTWQDYSEMVDGSVTRSVLVEYRQPSESRAITEELVAVAHVDVLDDGLSMLYSFFDPSRPKSSLGTFMILDNVNLARDLGLNYVYLGFWVPGSKKMGYKAKFSALEALRSGKWSDIGDRSAYEMRTRRPSGIGAKFEFYEQSMSRESASA